MRGSGSREQQRELAALASSVPSGAQIDPSSSKNPPCEVDEVKRASTGVSGSIRRRAGAWRKWIVRSIVGAGAGALSSANGAGSQASQ